jgi:DNA mismatch repair protein MutS
MATDATLDEKISPMMLQWHECKKKSEGALLLFRLGDFYEAFYADAVTLAKELELTLTKRQETPMAGIPFHTSEGYIDKLVGKGYRVAVAEQVEDPKLVKGIVKREVVRIVTPGTLINSSLLSEKSNNFIACLSHFNHTLGLSVLDLTTAEFKVLEFETFSALSDELLRLSPKELLISEKTAAQYEYPIKSLQNQISCLASIRDQWHFDPELTVKFLISHFQVLSLDSFGIQGMDAALHAAGSLLAYVKDDLNGSISHIQTLKKERPGKYMCLDGVSLRHLEILQSLHDGERESSLLHLLDQTQTPMGARLLKNWLTHPLLSVDDIKKRQEAISFFLSFSGFKDLVQCLSQIKDLERLIMKVETGFANPRDLLGLKISLSEAPTLLSLLKATSSPLVSDLTKKLCDVSEITQKIHSALSDEPPFRLSDGNVIKEGFSLELDELRRISGHDHQWIADYQNTLREETQIKTLKVGFTKAFGYYIEVSRGQAEKMPSSFQRRQTLLNAERFITPELKEYEHKVLSAEDKIASLESFLFHELRLSVAMYGTVIREIATAIAEIDCLSSLATVALKHDYVCPIIDEGSIFHVEGGRHPVIESTLHCDSFIPNDTFLDSGDNRLFVITGPNMAGKSTFIRQVALIAILAQIGSFVPAKKAHIGIVDKVFTRIGASDNLAKGQSTFMVEMTETANILQGATDRSLVILDEIGRGTSTYDGISIAWAVAEYLLTTPGKQAKTLFATHYCELTRLEGKIPGAINYNVAVHESDKDIVFLRKIVRGGTDKSYGIHVAKLAGLPASLLKNAKEMLVSLEKGKTDKKKVSAKEVQLSLFEPAAPQKHPLVEKLKDLDLNTLSPMDALNLLFELKKQLL